MNTAEWILVVILSVTLFIFLVLAIILIVKLIKFTEEAKKIVLKGQDIANKTGDVVDNIKNYTTVGGIASAFTSLYNTTRAFKNIKKGKNNEQKEEDYPEEEV